MKGEGPQLTLVLDPLAYMTAKSHGLDEECQSILEAMGATEDQLTMPPLGEPLVPPKVVVPTFKNNWPTKASSQSFFEKALLGQVDGLSLEDEPAANGAEEGAEEDASAKRNGTLPEEDDEDAAGWDMGDDVVPEVESDFVNVDSTEAGGAGSSEADLWARNSPLAVDHVAGGSFESAMQLLNRQIGAVNFAPLKPRFLEVYQASRTFLPASTGLPPLVNYARRTVEETDQRKVLPIVPRNLEHLAVHDLQKGYESMKANKLEDGVKIFRGIVHAILINAVSSEGEVEEAKKLISSATEYIVAMEIELSRRTLGDGDALSADAEKLKRSLELSAYFTIPKIEVPHRQLALYRAMQLAAKNKNYNSALSFANRMIANGGTSKMVETVSRTLVACFDRVVGANCPVHRPRRTRLSTNGAPMMRSTSSSTSLLSLKSAPRVTRRFTAALRTRNAPLTDPSTTPSTKALCAECVRCARLAGTVAG